MIDFAPACARMTEIVAGVAEDRLGDPTPCAEYAVKDLIGHIDRVAVGFAAVARKEDPAGGGVDFGDGWRERLAERLDGLAAAWADPAAWEGTGPAAGTELANEVWGRIAFTEVVVHGWDLARATGQPFTLPDATLEACWAHVSVFVPDAPIPELWSPPVPVPADAPLIDRIVAMTGRDPRW